MRSYLEFSRQQVGFRSGQMFSGIGFQSWLRGLCVVAALGQSGCGGGNSAPAIQAGTVGPIAKSIASFARGADIGWVSAEEAAGLRFVDGAGNATDPLSLLKGRGINAVRLRVWVNPSDGWSGMSDVVAQARRAVALGLRVMIDFHYSDTWADPGHQSKPAAWSSHDYMTLKNDVSTHTRDVLTALKHAGVPVEWVQVGNEVNAGMLWPDGDSNHFSQLAGLINSGYDAVHAVFPEALVIVHLANGYDTTACRWFFDNLKLTGGKWDAMGLSHYPPVSDWLHYNQQIGITMTDMVAQYGKPVLVTEVGMDWQQGVVAHAMISDLIGRLADQGAFGHGIFYWEPLAWPGWQGYMLGALSATGQLTAALDAYLN